MNNCNLNPDLFARTVKRFVPHEAIDHIAEALEVGEARIRKQIYPEDSDDTYLFRTLRFLKGYKRAKEKHPELEEKFKQFIAWWVAELSSLLDEPKREGLDLAVVLFNCASNTVVNAHLQKKPTARREAAIEAERLLREILSVEEGGASRARAGSGEGDG